MRHRRAVTTPGHGTGIKRDPEPQVECEHRYHLLKKCPLHYANNYSLWGAKHRKGDT